MFNAFSYNKPGYPYWPTTPTNGEFLDTIKSWSGSASPTFSEISVGSTSNSWYSGVVGQDGKVYGIPFFSTQVLEIDPVAGTSTTWGSVGSGGAKWGGGALANNGKIYCVPFNNSDILVIDTVNKTTSTFGTIGTSETAKYVGAVAHPNGKIYGIPLNAAKVVEIDPATDTASQVGATIAGGSGINNVLFGGGCVGSNGKIYMAPYNADYFWEYDPRTTSGSSFGSFPGDSLFVGIVTSPQNNMYAIPYYSQNVVKFNCNNTGSTTTIPVTGGTFSYKWYGGALGTDGKIYGSPINATSSLVINTFNDTVSQIGSYAGGVEQYTGCVLAPNGKLVHIPYNVTSSLVIDTIGSGDTPVGGPLSDVVKSGYLNKF